VSQTDPWALPQGTGASGEAGIPSTRAMPQLPPIPKALPFATMVSAGLYAIACVVAIFVLNSRASLADSLNSQDPSTFTQDTIDRANAADSHVTTTIVFAGGLFILTIILWILMQRRVKAILNQVGEYQAVYKRAGGPAVRIVSLVSLVLVLLSQSTSSSSGATSLSDVVSRDHINMLYLGVRVALGAAIAFYAYRLMRVSTETVDRINSAP
jgi:hypothetical protein